MCVQGFDCKELLYTDYKQLPAALEKSLNARYVKDVAELVKECDVVTINAPLHKVLPHVPTLPSRARLTK